MATLDDALRALRNRRRRELLFAVQEAESTVQTVSVPEGVVGETSPDRVALEYRHVHLPMLEDYGYIRWDRGRNEVSEGPRFHELRPVLEAAEEYQDRLEPTSA